MTISARQRREIEDFLIDYAAAIDDGELDRWPEFFGDPCLYKIVSKENAAAGLPLALLLCDSPGMIRDRCDAFARLNVYGPRSWRHLTGAVRITADGEETRARSNFVIFETLAGQVGDVGEVGLQQRVESQLAELAAQLVASGGVSTHGKLEFPSRTR